MRAWIREPRKEGGLQTYNLIKAFGVIFKKGEVSIITEAGVDKIKIDDLEMVFD